MAGNIIRTGIVLQHNILYLKPGLPLELKPRILLNLQLLFKPYISANGQMVMASTGQRVVQQPGGQQVGIRNTSH